MIVDDNEDVLVSLRLLFKPHYALIHCESKPERIPTILRNERYDVLLLDMNFTKDVMSGQEGFAWLETVLELDPQAVVILMTAYGDVETAIKAVKQGATDFILKPWHNEKLLATVSAAMQLAETRREVSELRSREEAMRTALNGSAVQGSTALLGVSPAMQRVIALMEKVAPTDANVLILGENGTGKEVVARELHRHSLRARQAFISVDMGAMSESLFESELFGHVKGAFTDAKEDRAGRFEIASGGTLFLDEIGNLSLPLQAKLLAALQNRTVTRVGSNKPIAVDIRLICATNMPLYEMVEQKAFRQDLLYRMNTVEIHLPPLRERTDDIPLLAEYFLREYSAKYRKPLQSLSAGAVKSLQAYSWRGNVRELQHVVERAVIMNDKSMLDAADLALAPAAVTESSDAATASVAQTSLAVDSFNLEELEHLAIRKALAKHNGNVSHAAQELGLTRAALYRRMEKYGL